MKFCIRCEVLKDDSEFYQIPKDSGNLHTYCKPCVNAIDASYRDRNREKVRAKQAEYRIANADRLKAKRLKHYAENAEEARKRVSEWRAKNPEKEKALCAAYRAANPEKCRVYGHNRRVREREAIGKISSGLVGKLLKLQRGKCACGCKQPLGDDYHLDHIMPLALGGSNTDDNIQLLRARCNLQKRAKHPVDFMQERGYLI